MPYTHACYSLGRYSVTWPVLYCCSPCDREPLLLKAQTFSTAQKLWSCQLPHSVLARERPDTGTHGRDIHQYQTLAGAYSQPPTFLQVNLTPSTQTQPGSMSLPPHRHGPACPSLHLWPLSALDLDPGALLYRGRQWGIHLGKTHSQTDYDLSI